MHFPSFSKIEQQVSPVSKPTNRNKDSTFASIPNLHLSVNVTRNEQVPIRVVIDTEYNGIVSFEMFLCNSLYTISCKRNQMEEYAKLTESTSHTLMLVSSDAEARKTPSGDHAISELPAVWPLKLRIITPVKGFHILTTLSAPTFGKCEPTIARISHNLLHKPQDANSVPSGLNFTADKDLVCPRNVCRNS
jgi:hypothetical protein